MALKQKPKKTCPRPAEVKLLQPRKYRDAEVKLPQIPLVVVVGPTGSGKSKLAVEIAKRFNGEVVSADSRQVYRGLDIGTDKITKQEMQGIPHYLLDVASPKRKFTVAQYQKKAHQAIESILKRGKLPILCGGTGFYIQAVVDNIVIPKVRPDWQLRKRLEQKTSQQLFEKLKKLDPKRAQTIERKNKRRLIRAIEIVLKTKKPVPKLKKEQPYNVLMLGLKTDKNELKEQIKKRFHRWLKQGLIDEVRNLKKSGLSWERIEEFGLEYSPIAKYLQNQLSYRDMVELSIKAIEQYAKRQMTWFKKDKRIIWLENKKSALELTDKFLKDMAGTC